MEQCNRREGATMRIMILTSSTHGQASLALAKLVASPDIDVAMVLFNERRVSNVWKERRRKLRKIRRIGPLGAMVGIKLRKWFREDVTKVLNIDSLEVTCRRLGIHFETTPEINCNQTRELVGNAGTELGLSLGNGYIGSRVFNLPEYGMVNVHHELLPEFRGAQSVIWQIYKGSAVTGYTIHQIDRRIDTGNILYREEMRIELMPSLRETVSHNYRRLLDASVDGLVHTIGNYQQLVAAAQPQGSGRTFSTPTAWQYIGMLRQHKRLYTEHLRGRG